MFPDTDRLRDIHGLDSIGVWPLAPGWWLLLLAVLIPLLIILWWREQRRRYPLGSWQKDAQRKLRNLQRKQNVWEPKKVAGELSELLRRIAMARHGREACAGLTGEAWLDWLRQRDPSGFDWLGEGRILLQLPYAPPTADGSRETLTTLIDAALKWVFAKQESDNV